MHQGVFLASRIFPARLPGKANFSVHSGGRKPQSGGSTQVPTQIIPISLFFEEFVEENGAHIVLDPAPVLPRVENSPNFRNAQYLTGFTQFAMQCSAPSSFTRWRQDWHTVLAKPQMLEAGDY